MATTQQEFIFRSATLLFKLNPVEDELNEFQISVFEKGLKDFLILQFSSQDTYNLNLVSVSVVKNLNASPINNDIDEDHVSYIESVIVAELPSEDKSVLNDQDFRNIVTNMCNEFVDILLVSWQKVEFYDIDKTDDNYDQYMIFNLVEDLNVQPIVSDGPLIQASHVVNNSAVSAIDTTMWVLGSLSFVFLLFWVYKRSKMFSSRSKVKGYTYDGVLGDVDPTTEKKSSIASLRNIMQRQSSSSVKGYDDDKKSMTKSIASSQKKRNRSTNKNTSRKTRGKYMTLKKGSLSINQTFSNEEEEISFHDDSSSSAIDTVEEGPALSINECYAPPGKLGVSIDTLDGVAVIHKIRQGSPLEGILYPNDVIVAIDEVDTSSMSSSAISSLLAKRMGDTRKIKYIRG